LNYFELHIGDYAQATGHLSFVEDAAYLRLVRKYYAEEKPIPADLKAAQRLVGARTRDEKEAVQTVLEEFFVLREDGWHQSRCDFEIARFQDKQAKAKRSAEARWNPQRPQSDGNANASDESMRTHSEGNALQAPSTKHQTPNTKHQIASAGEVCKQLRAAGLAGVNPSHPKLQSLLDAGITADELVAAAADGVPKGKGFGWVLATAEGRRRDAAVAPLPARTPSRGGYAGERNRAFAGEFADDAHLTIDEGKTNGIALPAARR